MARVVASVASDRKVYNMERIAAAAGCQGEAAVRVVQYCVVVCARWSRPKVGDGC